MIENINTDSTSFYLLSMEVDLNSFISALIGGSLAVLASYLSHKWDKDKEAKNETKLIANLVRSIHDK